MVVLPVELIRDIVSELLIDLLSNAATPAYDLVVDQLDFFVELLCFFALPSEFGDLVV